MGMNEVWLEIVGWLEANAPKTAAAVQRPVADMDSVTDRIQGFPVLPDQLQHLYRLYDGTERTPAGYIYPLFRALSAEEIVTTWQMLTDIWEQLAADEEKAMQEHQQDPLYLNLLRGALPELVNPYDPLRLGKQPAGTPSWVFLAEFIPFAENMSGDYLFVDTRPGPGFGSIRKYWKDSADSEETLWASVTELLSSLLLSLTQGRRLTNADAFVREGMLSWDLVFLDPGQA